MQGKKSENQERLCDSRENYRVQVRRQSHQSMLRTRRTLIIKNLELRRLFQQLECWHQPMLERTLLKLEQETSDSQHLELFAETLGSFQQEFHRLFWLRQGREDTDMLQTKLKVLVNVSTIEARVLHAETILSFIGEVLNWLDVGHEYALCVLKNMLLSKFYSEETEAFVVKGGWLRKLQELPKSHLNSILEVLSLAAGMPRTQIYLRERLLEMCLMFRQALSVVMHGEEAHLSNAYRIVVELIELNSNYCQQLTKQELSRMLNQLTYKPPLPKDYAGSILTALSIYTQDKTLAERLVRQQGLKIVTVYLGLNNINNRKGSAVVLLNCLRHLPGNEEVGDFITSLLFVSRLLFMLENDTVWIVSTILEIYRCITEQYERDLIESLVEAGIIEILVRRLVGSNDRQQKTSIFSLLSAISKKAQIKLDIANLVEKSRESDSKEDPDGKSKLLLRGEFYGSIYYDK